MSKKKSKTNKESNLLVYCGPSFSGELQQFAVYKNGIPKHLNNRIKECPYIEKMFIPISNLAKTREKLNIEGSRENQMYKKILEYQKKEV